MAAVVGHLANVFFPARAPCSRWHPPLRVEPKLPVVSTPSTSDAWLGHLYEPTVVVAKVDRNWPASIDAVLGLDVNGRRTCLRSNRHCPDPQSSTGDGRGVGCPDGGACLPPLQSGDIGAGGTADDWLVYPTPLADAPAQLAELSSSLGGVCSGSPQQGVEPRLSFDPTRLAQAYFFSTTALPPKLDRERLRGAPAKRLEYWFFYPFNYLPVSPLPNGQLVAFTPALFPTLDHHQGDFEHVDVILDAADKPLGVYMARHANEAVTVPFDDFPLEPDLRSRQPTHPVVFASIGGHASYESCTPHRRPIKRFLVLYDYPVCPSDQTTLRVPLRHGPESTVADAYVFSDMPLVPLRTDSWACWRGRLGVVPRIPLPAQALLPKRHLGALPRLQAWKALGNLGELSPARPGPAPPLAQDGHACDRQLESTSAY